MMETVTRTNLIDVVLAKEADASQKSLLETIKSSNNPDMHRMLDLTCPLV